MAHITDIEDFTSRCSRKIGEYMEAQYNTHFYTYFREHNIESPIEQILYTSLIVVEILNDLNNITLVSQPSVGKYRADFGLSYNKKRLLVECDSQQWHERTEKERRYEKERDRYIKKQGYEIFHYTGKEIMEDPIKTATEIIEYLIDRETVFMIGDL